MLNPGFMQIYQSFLFYFIITLALCYNNASESIFSTFDYLNGFFPLLSLFRPLNFHLKDNAIESKQEFCILLYLLCLYWIKSSTSLNSEIKLINKLQIIERYYFIIVFNWLSNIFRRTLQ